MHSSLVLYTLLIVSPFKLMNSVKKINIRVNSPVKFRIRFICWLAPEIVLHVTKWRHDIMSWRQGLTATCCKVAQWPTYVVKPWTLIWNQVYMLISAWDCFACHEMTSWRHVMTSRVDGNMLYSGPMTYPCSKTLEINLESGLYVD